MKTFEWKFMEGMKNRLGVELLGVVSVDQSAPQELRDKATSLLPRVKSVVVIGKELFKEIVALQRPSKEAGDADPGELLGPHIDYLSGRLNRAIYDLAAIFRKEGYRSLPLPSAGCPTDQRFLTAVFSY